MMLRAWLILVTVCGCGSQSRVAPVDLSVGGVPGNDLNSRLPPGQLGLILSHPPGPLYLSVGCHNTELTLTCPPSTTLVIEEANFSPSTHHQRLNCANRTKHSQIRHTVNIRRNKLRDVDVRQQLNRRCSGFRELCRFSLILDSPECRAWGPGLVSVWHRCVPKSKLTTTCGRMRVSGRGYIVSSTYPKYYMGGRSCSWHISVPPPSRLVIRVLDLALRGQQMTQACPDTLTINNKLSVCGELKTEVVYVAQTSRVSVVFNTSTDIQQIFPGRGVLLEYITVGCQPFRAPQNTVLDSYNTTHARYKCEQGHVFSHSLSTFTTLACTGHTYHAPLPPCTSVGFLLSQGNASVVQALRARNSGVQLQVPLMSAWFGDVVLPTIITSSIVILSLAGIIVLLLLHRHLTQVAYADDDRSALHPEMSLNSSFKPRSPNSARPNNPQNNNLVVSTMENYQMF